MATITPKEGEEVLLYLRKNLFVFYKQIIIFLLAFVAAVLAVVFLYQYTVVTITAVVVLVLALGYFFYYFSIWYYDIYVVTNMRVIALGRKSLFHKEFAEIGHKEIIDVSYVVKGFWATIFHFGTISMKLISGEIVELVNISSPDTVQENIKNLVDATNRHNQK